MARTQPPTARKPLKPVTFVGPLVASGSNGGISFALIQVGSNPLHLTYQSKTVAIQARKQLLKSANTVLVSNPTTFAAVIATLSQALKQPFGEED